MISLDQVLLLEQKVESAVEKIRQLQDENDALRRKCSELTNALSSKSEQLSSYENDQNQIEQGIRKALDRLTSIENSVLKAAGSKLPSFDTMETVKEAVPEQKNEIKEEKLEEEEPAIEEPINQDMSIFEAQSQQSQQTQIPTNNYAEEKLQPKAPVNPQSIQNTFEADSNAQVPFAEDIPDDTSLIKNQPEEAFSAEIIDEAEDEMIDDSEDDESQDNLGFDIF